MIQRLQQLRGLRARVSARRGPGGRIHRTDCSRGRIGRTVVLFMTSGSGTTCLNVMNTLINFSVGNNRRDFEDYNNQCILFVFHFA